MGDSHLSPDELPGIGADVPVDLASDFNTLMGCLKGNPHDPERWKRLVDVAESSGDVPRIREAYDALLKQYPNTASAQIAYLRHFTNNTTPTRSDAKELLNRFLHASPSTELWNLYLTYVRRINSPTSSAGRENVRKAYEFALENIGQDRDSGPMWAGYIQFLSAGEGNSAWDASQKIEALRKTYHRCVQIPLDNVELLWSQYEAFEMGLDKITAKKFISHLSPAHMQARTVLRQLKIHLNALGINNQSGIFLPAPATFSGQERQLIARWKAYLKWEEANPLAIEAKDNALLISRIQMVYRKAVIRMRYYPEIWFMAYSWTTSVGNDGQPILKAGLEANPDSFALTYAYTELLEKAQLKEDQQDFTEIHTIYERFFSVLRVELARLSAVASEPPAYVPSGNASDLEAVAVNLPIEEELAVRKMNQDELHELKKQYSNAWINYMRFARRAQGQRACRDVFGKAREDEYIGWEVYEAAAMAEYRCNLKDGRLVAARIFELGMKKYSSELTYVLSHLRFLLTVNDENNARALFERVIGTFTPQEAKPIWECWSYSQYQYDDLEAVLHLERRMAELYPNDPPIKRFAQRHTYHSLDAIADHDLGFAKTRRLSPGATAPTLKPNGNGGGNEATTATQSFSPNSNKRPPPPLDRERETEYKRLRLDNSERDHLRQYSPPPPPSIQRNHLPPRRHEPPPKEIKPLQLPPILHCFVSQLPPRETFDGPIFSITALMDQIRQATIPSSASRSWPTPPPPSRFAGRPPPDYGPYQALGTSRRAAGEEVGTRLHQDICLGDVERKMQCNCV
ncbi:Suf-domain-containing protein [Mycena metata]|uniref:mRNA 3'-end-processing protein RNA14 n=1 Tax=Mycena metata TaxID=1033252 RepID=A0AAD7MYK6_9AGAR|nr:Suf-domain-containing protein [Mycena metata]